MQRNNKVENSKKIFKLLEHFKTKKKNNSKNKFHMQLPKSINHKKKLHFLFKKYLIQYKTQFLPNNSLYSSITNADTDSSILVIQI